MARGSKLAGSFMLQKRIGQLAEGNAAWLRLVDKDGKLGHVINPQGTVTGRMSSFRQSSTSASGTRSEFGAECRELFTVPRGYQLVGADLSGIGCVSWRTSSTMAVHTAVRSSRATSTLPT